MIKPPKGGFFIYTNKESTAGFEVPLQVFCLTGDPVSFVRLDEPSKTEFHRGIIDCVPDNDWFSFALILSGLLSRRR
jgi:hypothetical protein